MRTPTRHYDRFGASIDKDTWASNRADPTYCQMEVYDNGSVRCEIEWLGKVKDPELMAPEYWPLFKLHVGNYVDADTASGKRLVPAFETGQTFGSHADALAAYQKFLLEWTNCSMEPTKAGTVFTEEDNVLAPPPPEDLDKPESNVVIGNDGAGVW